MAPTPPIRPLRRANVRPRTAEAALTALPGQVDDALRIAMELLSDEICWYLATDDAGRAAATASMRRARS